MDIKIVKAKPQDYDGFLVVFREIEKLHRINVSWKFIKPKSESYAKKYFLETIHNKKGVFLLAKDKEEVIGYIFAFKKTARKVPIIKQTKWVEVDVLSVRSDYRNKGIGELLMNKVEIWAKKSKISSLELNVWCFNKGAVKFYEKRGYDTYNLKMRKVIK